MIILVLALFGLVLGSFVNAFVWRLHEREQLLNKPAKPSQKQLDKLSIMKGRSMCPDCHHELAAKDLVPLASWLSLKGKCRYCHKPISMQYPVVELLTSVLFVVSYLYWPLNFTGLGLMQFGFWLFFVVAFMILAVYDLSWYLLPDKVVFPLIIVAGIEVLLIGGFKHSVTTIASAGLAAIIISGLFYGLFQVSDGTWIGGGDVKLAVVLGFLAAAPARSLLVLFFASLIGSLVSVPLSMKSKKGLRMQVPFGPFLLAATVIVVLFGSSIIDWYITSLLG